MAELAKTGSRSRVGGRLGSAVVNATGWRWAVDSKRWVAVACAVNRPPKAEVAREPLALISDVFLVRLPAGGEVGVADQELQQLCALFAEHPEMLGIHVAEPTHAKEVASTPRSQPSTAKPGRKL
jgi:hypothetical protein